MKPKRTTDETIIHWYKLICRTWKTCFDWSDI